MMKSNKAVSTLLVLIAALTLSPSGEDLTAQELSRKERRERMDRLAPEYKQFLEDVSPLISPAERDAFLMLETDDQRELFIDEFWRRRNAQQGRDDVREEYYARLEIVDQRFRHKDTDRGRIFMIRGEPSLISPVEQCQYIYDVTIWTYAERGSDDIIMFFKPFADYRLWAPLPNRTESLENLLTPAGKDQGQAKVFYPWRDGNTLRRPLISRCRNHEVLLAAIEDAALKGTRVFDELQPPAIDEEAVDRLLRSTVIRDPKARSIEASAEVSYGGAKGTRTTTLVTVTVPGSEITPLTLDGSTFHRVNLIGEVSRDDRMFEKFRYRYDFADLDDGSLPLLFERYLREGAYKLRIKVTDEGSNSEAFVDLDLDVPPPADSMVASSDGTIFDASEAVIRISESSASNIQTGFVTFETVTTPEVSSVEFFVDGVPAGTKTRAPHELNLDLGPVPRLHVIQATALDSEGSVLGSDRITINDGVDPFRVRIVSPRMAKDVTGRTRIEIESRIPEKSELESIEVFLDDKLVATLYDEPFVAWADFGPDPTLRILKVVATLDDPRASPAEDISILNAPGTMESLDVRLIELPVAVFDQGKPVRSLERTDFAISDNVGPIEIVRFEKQDDLPLSVGLAIDSSASMETRMDAVREAASDFLANVMQPGDQAFLMAFGRLVWNPAGWTSNRETLRYALASLRAESTTSLYDGVIESLYQFEGKSGRKAVILLSDGADNASKFGWEATISYARRMSIPVYALGMSIPPTQILAKSKLARIAEETGGRAWFFDDTDALPEIYATIERELRSQYMLSFYAREAESPDWVPITVSSDRGDVRAPAGYYP